MAYTPEQQQNIRIALNRTRRDSPRVRMALLEAMRVESNFRHLNYGDRSSMGVLQQRPDYGWGPYIKGAKGVRQDIDDFLVRARRNEKTVKGTPGQLAQSVQRSAFPDRYDQSAGRAREILGSKLASSPGLRIAEAQGAFGGLSGASGSAGATSPVAGNAVVGALFQNSADLAAGRMPDPGNLVQALVEQRQVANQPSAEAQSLAANTMTSTGSHVGVKGGKGIHELFYDPLGGIDEGKSVAAIGGHDDHVHMSLANRAAQARANRVAAKRFGLTVGENTDSNVDPVHTKGSWHYKNYRKGDPLRMASDISGNPRQMAAFYRWVSRNYR